MTVSRLIAILIILMLNTVRLTMTGVLCQACRCPDTHTAGQQQKQHRYAADRVLVLVQDSRHGFSIAQVVYAMTASGGMKFSQYG